MPNIQIIERFVSKNSVLRAKLPFLKGINPSELRLAPKLESDTAQFSKSVKSRAINLVQESKNSIRFTESLNEYGQTNFKVFDGKDYVGYGQKHLITNQKGAKGTYPDSWFDGEPATGNLSGKLKPYLEIDLVVINEENRNKSYGVKVFKKLLDESIQKGCEGRMTVCSAWEASEFYHKIGFEVAPSVAKAFDLNNKKCDFLIESFKKQGFSDSKIAEELAAAGYEKIAKVDGRYVSGGDLHFPVENISILKDYGKAK